MTSLSIIRKIHYIRKIHEIIRNSKYSTIGLFRTTFNGTETYVLDVADMVGSNGKLKDGFL